MDTNLFTTPLLSITSQIEAIIHACFKKFLFASSVFYADKLVTLTNGNPDAVFLLAQALFFDEQFSRARYVLKKFNLVPEESSSATQKIPLKYRYLACLSEVRIGNLDNALKVLGDNASLKVELLSSSDSSKSPEICLEAAICLTCAEIFQETGNVPSAVGWYKQGVLCDVNMFEAFERLVDNKMLTSKEETDLFQSLKFTKENEWLKVLYQLKINQHNRRTSPSLEESCNQIKNDLDVMTGIATNLYLANKYHSCYDVITRIMESDKFFVRVLPLRLCTLVALKKTTELFRFAHELVEANQQDVVSWFAVGCYYFVIQRYDDAKRYFSKATEMDSQFAAGWIGYGHSFAKQDESDQAMAAYRNAGRLARGCHLPKLFIGMEYLRKNDTSLADQFFREAKMCCSMDPLLYNELGVCSFKSQRFPEALRFFERALEIAGNECDTWESLCINIGHTYRKLRKYEKAVEYFQRAFSLSPNSASLCSVIAFTYHLQDLLEEAIQYYHKALGLRASDAFTSDMVTTALEELYGDGGAVFGY